MGINYQSSNFTLTGDHFKISCYSQVTGVVLAISGRMQNIDGDVVPYEHRLTIAATGAQTVRYPAPGGFWVMSCVASVVSGTVNPGEVLVKVELTQGDTTSAVPFQLLLFGNPDSFMPVAMGV